MNLRMRFDLSYQARRLATTMKKLGLFAPYILLAVLITWAIAGPQQPVYSLFQSPMLKLQDSPVATPTNTPEPPPPTDTPEPPPPTDTPEPPPPTDTPVPPTETPASVSPEDGSLQSQEVQTTTETLTSTQPLTATIPDSPPPAQQEVEPVVPPAPPQPVQPPASGDVVINEVELIDTVVQWFAYGWMCFGVGFILLALIIFPLLQIRGAHLKRSQKS